MLDLTDWNCLMRIQTATNYHNNQSIHQHFIAPLPHLFQKFNFFSVNLKLFRLNVFCWENNSKQCVSSKGFTIYCLEFWH